MAGRVCSCLLGKVATRKFVSAMPCASWFADEEAGGAEGKVRSMEVFSSAPVGGYLEMEERTVGGLRAEGGRVW